MSGPPWPGIDPLDVPPFEKAFVFGVKLIDSTKMMGVGFRDESNGKGTAKTLKRTPHSRTRTRQICYSSSGIMVKDVQSEGAVANWNSRLNDSTQIHTITVLFPLVSLASLFVVSRELQPWMCASR